MFDHIKPINPRTERLKRRLIAGTVLFVALSGYLYYEFKNYPEEQQAKRFFAALQREDWQEAYRLWNPTSSYTFKDFQQDWGPEGLEGRVETFRIAGSHERGSGVLVIAQINGSKDVTLWVEKKDKSLSFPPF